MIRSAKRKLASLTLAAAMIGALVLPTGVLAAVGDFKTFLTNSDAATATLENRAPRDITVTAPQKYIESIEVIHKKAETYSDSVSITNIDVETNGSNLRRLTVTAVEVNEDGEENKLVERVVAAHDIDGETRHFQLGLANLPDSYDLIITVHDRIDNLQNHIVETKKFFVPEGSSDIFRISEEFSYTTPGESYTLYQLLDDPSLFTELLTEHKLKEISMSHLRTN